MVLREAHRTPRVAIIVTRPPCDISAIAVFMKIIGHVRHFRWLGPNVWWEISQIWIEYIKLIRQMSDEPWKFFGYTAIGQPFLRGSGPPGKSWRIVIWLARARLWALENRQQWACRATAFHDLAAVWGLFTVYVQLIFKNLLHKNLSSQVTVFLNHF